MLSFYSFQDKLSLQASTYSPVNQFYKGDKHFREVTGVMTKKRRAEKQKEGAMPKTPRLSKDDFDNIERDQKKAKSRYYGDLEKLHHHINSKQAAIVHSVHQCAVVGRVFGRSACFAMPVFMTSIQKFTLLLGCSIGVGRVMVFHSHDRAVKATCCCNYFKHLYVLVLIYVY
jgi:hypothetical protein